MRGWWMRGWWMRVLVDERLVWMRGWWMRVLVWVEVVDERLVLVLVWMRGCG